ncbi:protein-cysteine N-palmitoyltransferase HHAT-like isoform X1 [Biomphalaria glabrata]|nr:protein-cysteine N-palmitoyltransferase HHAT-like isoform X1 [Biomphalaria glabrata]
MYLDVLPKWERITYWIVSITSIAYGLYRLHVEGDKYKESFYYLVPGWPWLNREQDISDSEFSLFRDEIQLLILVNTIHIILSQMCYFLSVQVKVRICILSVYDILVINYFFGVRPFLLLLAKCIIMYSISRLGRIRLVWLAFLAFMLSDISSLTSYYKWKYLNISSIYSYTIANGFFELSLLSFALDKIHWRTTHHPRNNVTSDNLQTQELSSGVGNDEEREPNFLDLVFYVFHLPKFNHGPFYPFKKFHFEVMSCFKAATYTVNIWDIVKKLLRFMLWALFLEFQLHYFYYSQLGFSEDILEQMSLPAVMAAGYWQGQMFMVKYVCFYGISGQLLRFDGVIPFSNPRCISWVYSYTDMWRYFDVGLYEFVKMYIYIPIGGSKCGYIGQLVSSAISFFFIFMWHGFYLNLFYWCLGNFITVSLERLGQEFMKHSALGIQLKSKLSPAWQLRLLVIVLAPVYVVSCWGIFFFFFDIDVTLVIIKKMTASWLSMFLEMVVITSAMHNALDISMRKQAEKEIQRVD